MVGEQELGCEVSQGEARKVLDLLWLHRPRDLRQEVRGSGDHGREIGAVLGEQHRVKRFAYVSFASGESCDDLEWAGVGIRFGQVVEQDPTAKPVIWTVERRWEDGGDPVDVV